MRSLFALGFLALAAASQALGFSDVVNWTGAGSNQAALVIDWSDGGPEDSLVWGYRWDGAATGEDMLRAILASDSRLYIKVSGQTPYGVALFGIGYDRNGGGLALTTGETFTNRVIEVEGYDRADGGVPTDPADRYREGWYTGYWSYWLAEGVGALPTESEWGYSPTGMTGRPLQNGSWDGWRYDDFGGTSQAPSIPIAAPVPEPASLAALGVGALALLRRRRR